MHTKQIGEKLFQIDLQTGNHSNLIASYVLKGQKTIIVETGPASSTPNLLAGLQELQVNPADVTYVALTHIHIDHGGGVGTLLKSLPNAKVIVHAKGASHLADPTKLWAASQETLEDIAQLFGEPEPVEKDRIIIAGDGDVFSAGEGVELRAVETPGHAAHNLSYYEPLNQGIFTGDSAGAYLSEFDTVFPTTPPPFRPDIALASIEKLVNLNPQYLYYSHFGKAQNAVKRLQGYAKQIKLWLNITQKALKQGCTDEQIRQKILSQDPVAQKIAANLQANPIHNKTLIKNSTQGFINYAKKKQQSLKEP
ncbi:MAG: MBL fold metallo-hydrolase [Candidatus Bathyarchaeota archaeon]|nr:MBL fold metallo-hydrolase [Candidatus Bathyarchaeota archaeon]